jgi:hypothetical protein
VLSKIGMTTKPLKRPCPLSRRMPNCCNRSHRRDGQRHKQRSQGWRLRPLAFAQALGLIHTSLCRHPRGMR